jgi:predicted Fe-Mo cluster-binding NifX family protein
MKVAIPHWQSRVSPVFDVAQHVVLVDLDAPDPRNRTNVILDDEDPARRARQLAGSGAEILICGAISLPMETAVSAAGIRVVAQICGNIECVLQAFAENRLGQDAFRMPGCCGRRRRYHGGRRAGRS